MLTGRGRPPKYCLRCEPEKQRLDPAQKVTERDARAAAREDSKVTLACDCGHEVHQVSHLAEHTRSRPGKTPWRGTKRTDRCAGRQ